MEIKKDYLTINKYSRPSTKLNKVKGIVVHYVGNTNSTAKNNRDYFNNLANKKDRIASAHYIIDDKEIIQCIPNDEVAYHCGGNYTKLALDKLGSYPNKCTIGIECCHVKDDGTMTDNTYKQLIELTRQLLKEFNLTIDDIYLHNDITGKNCHAWFVKNKIEWENFKEEVAKVKTNTPQWKIDGYNALVAKLKLDKNYWTQEKIEEYGDIFAVMNKMYDQLKK